MSEQSVERDRLNFDRAKWSDEKRIREREVAVKEQEQGGWLSPTVVAIFAAAIAALGNLLVNWYNGSNEQKLEYARSTTTANLEKQKAEAARILEVVKTGDPEKAAVNLDALLKMGLISDPDTQKALKAYLAQREAGKGLALPAGGVPVISGKNPSAPPNDGDLTWVYLGNFKKGVGWKTKYIDVPDDPSSFKPGIYHSLNVHRGSFTASGSFPPSISRTLSPGQEVTIQSFAEWFDEDDWWAVITKPAFDDVARQR